MVNGSRYAVSAKAVFENSAPRVLLLRSFQTAMKIAYNLTIFTLYVYTEFMT